MAFFGTCRKWVVNPSKQPRFEQGELDIIKKLHTLQFILQMMLLAFFLRQSYLKVVRKQPMSIMFGLEETKENYKRSFLKEGPMFKAFRMRRASLDERNLYITLIAGAFTALTYRRYYVESYVYDKFVLQ